MANTTTRRCIGSTRFGIEPHDATVEDFPVQPSQRDGLGRMCKVHWNQYTSALRKAALASKAGEADAVPRAEAEPVAEREAPTLKRGRRSQTEIASKTEISAESEDARG